MEVKEFVKTILKDVTEAVEESTSESKTHDFTTYGGDDKKINFDLAVVLEQSGEGKIGADVFKIVSGNFKENYQSKWLIELNFLFYQGKNK